jgi:hypothetical protein
VLVKVNDDISTNEIPATSACGLPYRCDIDKIAKFTFPTRRRLPAMAHEPGAHVVIRGADHGHASSHEHSTLPQVASECAWCSRSCTLAFTSRT